MNFKVHSSLLQSPSMNPLLSPLKFMRSLLSSFQSRSPLLSPLQFLLRWQLQQASTSAPLWVVEPTPELSACPFHSHGGRSWTLYLSCHSRGSISELSVWDLRSCLLCCGGHLLCMGIFGPVCSAVVVICSAWRSLVLSALLWWSSALHGDLWSCLLCCGGHLLCMEIFGPVCSAVVVICSAWRSLVLSALLWWSSALPWGSLNPSALLWWSSALHGDLWTHLLCCGGHLLYMGIFGPVCSAVVVICSTMGIFEPICSAVVVICSAWRSLVLSALLWWSSALHGDLWSCLLCCGGHLLCMEIFGPVCSAVVVICSAWRSLVLSALLWWSSALHGDLWSCLLCCGGHLLCMEIFGPVCSAVVVICSTMGIFEPICSAVVVICSTMGIFGPVCSAVVVICSTWGSSVLSALLWWSSALHGDLRSCLLCCGGHLLCMEIFGPVCSAVVVICSAWRSLVLSALLWWSSALHGDLWSCLLCCGGHLLCMEIFGPVCSAVVVICSAWRSLVLSALLWWSSALHGDLRSCLLCCGGHLLCMEIFGPVCSAVVVFSSVLGSFFDSPSLASCPADSALVFWFNSGSRPPFTTWAWPTIPPPDHGASGIHSLKGVMSQPSAGLSMTANRGHSSRIIAYCLWTFYPITLCSVYQVSLFQLHVINLVNFPIFTLCSLNIGCCSIVLCFCVDFADWHLSFVLPCAGAFSLLSCVTLIKSCTWQIHRVFCHRFTKSKICFSPKNMKSSTIFVIEWDQVYLEQRKDPQPLLCVSVLCYL